MTLTEIYDCAFNSFTINNHIRDENSGIDIYIGTSGDNQIINAYGSTEDKDWITNFKFFLKPYRLPNYARPDSKIKVHSGYLDGWESIRQQVLDLVDITKNIIVTGYSMGGGLSTLIAVDIQYNKSIDMNKFQVVDFEGPKIWNRAGRDSYNKRIPHTIKITYSNDIVPKIPFWYYSAGMELHIGEKKRWWLLSVKDHVTFQMGNMIKSLLKEL